MHGFIASPAMAKLVALSMVEEEFARSHRARKARPSRADRRAVRASARAARAAKEVAGVPRPAST